MSGVGPHFRSHSPKERYAAVSLASPMQKHRIFRSDCSILRKDSYTVRVIRGFGWAVGTLMEDMLTIGGWHEDVNGDAL
jgi:hypothetical protein